MDSRTITLDSEDRREFAERLIHRIKIDPPLDVTITEHHDQRSNEQNKRLWALHQLAAEHIGCSAAEVHEDMLCEHFGYNEVKMPSGIIKRIPLKRSSMRNKKEFRAFLDAVENFYIEKLGVWLDDRFLK